MMRNQIMLITYPDSMGKNLRETYELLDEHFKGVIGGIHILPFFPSSADRGFAPMTYQEVDPQFGTWEDLRKLAQDHCLMVDFMINHISQHSVYFRNFKQFKDKSPYANLFIRYKDFWPNGEPTQEDVDLIYKRKPRAPYIDVTFADGTTEKIWCTFDEEQIDLNLMTEATKAFVKEQLTFLADQGASAIRLDAFAYATKKTGTNCFFVEPDTWSMLDEVTAMLAPFETVILPEIHEHYTIQMKLAARGYWVYDFALPMLVLYSLYSGKGHRLKHWLKIAPKRQFTTLDTHDGIGVVDAVDLLSEAEIEETKEQLFAKGANVKKAYNTTEYHNLDIYQLNCTYYSALGNNDDAYVFARAIQFFTPGIPQVYYVGLLAGENDISLLEETKVGRNINRHYYSKEEVVENLQRPVLQRLFRLMTFRNTYAVFDGDVEVIDTDDESTLIIKWTDGPLEAILTGNLRTHAFHITYVDPATGAHELLTGI